MAEGRARSVGTAVVVRTERLTPHMVRLVLGGDGLAGFGAGEFTDHYIKILFPRRASPTPRRGTSTGSAPTSPGHSGRASARTPYGAGTRRTWS